MGGEKNFGSGERGHQISVDAELIRAIKSKFPHMSKLKPRAIVEIALGKLLIDRSGPNSTQTVIQVPVPPPAEKVRIPPESLEEQKALDRRAAKELERELKKDPNPSPE
jgi:hypothetical protein